MHKKYENLLVPYIDQTFFDIYPGSGPLVSILMAYYNNSSYILDTLESIQDQNYENWELLLVDDCSPEPYPSGIEKFDEDGRIRFLRLEKNCGAATARNVAFSHSAGDYVIYFDADDIMHPDFLGALVGKALSLPQSSVVMSDTLCFGSENILWRQKIKTEKCLTIANWIPGQSLMKRRVWENAGGQSTAKEIRFGCQDWNFWLSAVESNSSLTFSHVQFPLFLYRRHGASITSNRSLHEYAIRKYMYSAHKSLFLKYGTGGKFLAVGYVTSIDAHFRRGNVQKALSLFAQACREVPTLVLVTETARVLYGKLPLTIRKLIRSARNRFKFER